MLRYGVALFLSISTICAQPFSFLPPKLALSGGLHYPFAANCLAVGDFNQDGKLDLVTVGPSTGLGQTPLTVSLGNGDGTFQSPKVLDANDTVVSPVVADFNGDGHPDIAFFATPLLSAGPFAAGIVVILGNGDGTFKEPSYTSVSAAGTKVIAIVADSRVSRSQFSSESDHRTHGKPISVLLRSRSAFSRDSDHFEAGKARGDRERRRVIGMRGERRKGRCWT